MNCHWLGVADVLGTLVCWHSQCNSHVSVVMPSSHRRHRQDTTVLSCLVGVRGVNWIGNTSRLVHKCVHTTDDTGQNCSVCNILRTTENCLRLSPTRRDTFVLLMVWTTHMKYSVAVSWHFITTTCFKNIRILHKCTNIFGVWNTNKCILHTFMEIRSADCQWHLLISSTKSVSKSQWVSLWPWPLTSDLENLFIKVHSNDEYLWQVSLKSIH